MFYFVPSWNMGNKYFWDGTTKPWYENKNSMEFDDTISQIRMFVNEEVSTKTLILNYFPMLRSFMHRQGLYGANYYSVFDDLQNINVEGMRSFSFTDLKWPQNVEFRYTPFFVLASIGEKIFAQIDFSEDGKVIRVKEFSDEHIEKTYFFDDRGFLSSVRTLDGYEQSQYQEFFDLSGQCQFKVDLNSSEVNIAPIAKQRFKKDRYNNIDDLIVEKYNDYLMSDFSNSKDFLVIAASNDLAKLEIKGKEKEKTVYSFFSKRKIDDKFFNFMKENAASNIVDTENLTQILKNKEMLSIQITPFDSRLRLGHSQQSNKSKILFLVNGIKHTMQKEILKKILIYMKKYKDVELVVASYNENDKASYQKHFNELLNAEPQFSEFVFDKPADNNGFVENSVAVEQQKQRNIRWKKMWTENDFIEELSDTRLIIDLAQVPDLFLQIAAISAGIPQINQVETDYVKNKKNGLIISRLEELSGAMKYYLNGLSNWNKALVYTTNQISKFSSKQLVKQWMKLLEVENNGSND